MSKKSDLIRTMTETGTTRAVAEAIDGAKLVAVCLARYDIAAELRELAERVRGEIRAIPVMPAWVIDGFTAKPKPRRRARKGAK